MKVRQFGRDEITTLRAIRLRALQDAPHAYGSTYEGTVGRTDDEWRAWFDTVTPFIAEGSDGAPLGLAATYRDPDEPAAAQLISMWVAPEARGTGAGDVLVQQILSFASAHGAAVVRLHVVEGNDPAVRLYERNGFRFSGRQIVRERDNAVEFEMEFTTQADAR